jgi:thiamine-phosphate pyrophosphorylase
VPRLWLFTDPARTPDPVSIARRLPAGAAVVYRHFGAADRVAVAARLSALSRRRGLVLWIGADPRLARRFKAHLHMPTRYARAARAEHRRGGRLVTLAWHDTKRRPPAACADAYILSPLKPTSSASGRMVLDKRRAMRLTRTLGRPIIALGGLRTTDARELARSGFAGLAGVDLFGK